MTDIEFENLLVKLRERPNWSDYSEQVLKRCYRGGFPVDRLVDQPYGGKQMRELCVGLETGVDIDQFADVTISARKMQEIRESLPSLFRPVSASPDDGDTTEIPVPATKPEPTKITTKVKPVDKPLVLPEGKCTVDDPKKPLANMAKSDESKKNDDTEIIVMIDNPTHWKDIELLESELTGLTPDEFCRKAGISGADTVSIDKADFESLIAAKAGVTISVSIRIRDHGYVLLADVVGNESLNAAQLEQICLAREAGLPFHLLVGFEADQMHEIRMGLLSLDRSIVELYAKNHFTAYEMRYLRWTASLGYQPESMSMLDASAFALKKLTENLPFFPISVFRGVFDQDQIQMFTTMWNEGLRDFIPSLARLHLSTDQLREVRKGLLISRRAISYAHPEFSPDQMRDMRLDLEKKTSKKACFLRRLELSRIAKSQQQQVKELQSNQAK